MNPSKVYFTTMATSMRESVTDKMLRLCKAAGIDTLDVQDKYVAIKLHFGEDGNLAYLRHNYAAALAQHVKARGGKPFVTDCNTLYIGSRTNALDHLACASRNGYNTLSLGCEVIIADGLLGKDERLVPVEGGEYVQQAKIGAALMDADVVISLSHFKGHEAAGIGGAIKNLGMGGGSRAGKMEMHCSGKPQVDDSLCVGCKLCGKACAHAAIGYATGKAVIDHDKCVGCARCIEACPKNAIQPPFHSNEFLNKKMAEYAAAVVKGRPQFHVALAIDISPFCDCYSVNDVPIIPDVGMFASFDPVALDHACVDACNAQPVEANSALAACAHTHGDHFADLAPTTDWAQCLQHCEKLGVGSFGYELVTVK
ncbi:MAG: DUF362 domain-containing protein [Oscillospiraceae bacterium]|nr:DUF362 domain-containing protein [Oscillospiraceae bacterium]